MSYFNFIPNTEYKLQRGGSVTIAKNILVRAKILESIRNFESSALEYTIEDDERPEHIAFRAYGRADYHWIILLYNEIHDPFFDWPMSTNEFEGYMVRKYPGKSLFINTGGLVNGGGDAILNSVSRKAHDRRRPHFEVGSEVRQVDSSGKVVASATVLAWDPTLWKLEVEPINGVFRLQGLSARVDRNTGQLLPVSAPLDLPRDLRCTNSEGEEISASLLRVTENNRYALHHFENASGEIISPWYLPGGSASPLIERYVCGRQEVIATDDGVFNIVTNQDYEERKNESKRKIKVMKPIYIDPLLRDFNKIMGG